MRTAARIGAWLLGVLIGLPLLVVALLLALLNTGFGRGQVERLVGQLTGGQVAATGLSGRFPDALRLAHAEIRDAQGPWLVLDGVALDWSPTCLLWRQARVDRLRAERMQMPRLPQAAPSTPAPASDATEFSLPVQVTVRSLHIARAEIGAPVAGIAVVLALDGGARLASLQDGSVDVTIDRLDTPGAYAVHGQIDPAHITAKLRLDEPSGGLVARLASLPDIGTVALAASIDGPRNAEATQVTLTAGPLTATAQGSIDLVGQAADLHVTAQAPAMAMAPGVAWQAIALDAHVHGKFTQPDATGTLSVTALQAAGASVADLAARVQGNQGTVGLSATLTGLRIPGPQPALFAAAPVTLQADAKLDDPARPVTFVLAHPLLQAKGLAQTGGNLAVRADLTAPDLAPFAAIGGVALAGRTQLAVAVAQASGGTRIDVDGTVGVTGGMAPVPGLLGEAAKIGLSAAMTGGDVAISRARLDGRAITLDATGSRTAGMLDATYTVGLGDLAVLAPTIAGAMRLQGTVKGPADDLAIDAHAAGDFGTRGVPRGPLALAAHATGLPGKPAGSVTAQGTLEGAPLNLGVHAERGPDGALHATIDHADWKSLHAEGAVTLPPGVTVPQGRVGLRMTRLDDLRPFIGQPVDGSVTADLALTAATATLALEAVHAGIPGSQVGHAKLAAHVADPLGHPVVDASLAADGIEAGGVAGSAKLSARGPEQALALTLSAALPALAGAPATLAAAATLDMPAKTVLLSSLVASYKAQDMRLLTPARFGFGGGVAVDRLRIGVQQAVLDIAGRFSPALNLVGSLRGATPDLARPFVPGLDAAGQIAAEAKLTGTPAAPQGNVHLTATGLRQRTGPARALPPTDITATVTLAGQAANVDVRLVAGRSTLAVTGRAPLGAGALALRATGAVDLAMLDPILAPEGRRARGQVALDAAIAGAVTAPLVTGSVVLTGGEIQDFAQGVHLTDLAATLQGTGETIRIASLTGHAGAGAIAGSGSVGLQGPMPVDVTLTLRQARALSSDRLTADLDADLALRGAVQTGLDASGSIAIQRATINIPEHLPSSVAVLQMRVAGQKPPPPVAPAAAIRLDLALTTPGQIFVRGRGLDAILGGSLHVGGTSSAPQISGGFALTRGTFTLAGAVLTFSRGKVGFDGAGTTDKIDPSLDFEADAVTSSLTAMLLVGGYASAPKIRLASSPTVPQDEVLAQLLFGRSAKELGPLQYASIASALADLSGGPSVGNPLDRVRKGLGLDRLSVGSGAGTSSSSTTATVEAGRYVANGVYVGAKQGTSGAQTQATVEIDITKGLKAQTDVGTGAGGNSVGLTYQFDY